MKGRKAVFDIVFQNFRSGTKRKAGTDYFHVSLIKEIENHQQWQEIEEEWKMDRVKEYRILCWARAGWGSRRAGNSDTRRKVLKNASPLI